MEKMKRIRKRERFELKKQVRGRAENKVDENELIIIIIITIITMM